MISVIGPINSGVAAGGAGVATANITSTVQITGKLLGFYLSYEDSPPATTDILIEAVDGVLPTRTLLSLADANTSGYFSVEEDVISPAGAAIAGISRPQPLVRDKLKVTIAQANNGDSLGIFAVVEK